MSEEGFHEIQLSGKQMVFLGMAATVVVVVVFLIGVMVGRGVKAQAADVEPAPQAADLMSPMPSPPSEPGNARPAVDASTPPPQPVNDDLSYYNRLGAESKPAETLGTPAAATPAPATPAAPAKGVNAFSVQVAALAERQQATALVQRLIGKGYAAYLVEPEPGGSSAVYRVRVGKFPTRSAANAVAARLKQEEKFAPWVIPY